MSPQPVRVGVVGCGGLACSIHLPNLARLPGARVTALVDPEPERLAAGARHAPRAARLGAYEEALRRDDVDALLICTPPPAHAEAAALAFAAGKHVYLEKPLATTVLEGERVAAAWRESGLVGAIGFPYRFSRPVVHAAASLRAGAVGEVVAARSVFSTAQHEMPDWKRSRATGGGPLLDLVSHDVDLVRFLLGREIEQVIATASGANGEPDTICVQLRLEGGFCAQLLASLLSAEDAALEVYGRLGKLTAERYAASRARVSAVRARGIGPRLFDDVKDAFAVRTRLAKLRSPGHEPAFRLALERFLDAVRGRSPATPDLEDGLRSLEVVAAAEASLVSGNVTPVRRSPAV